MTGYPPYTIGTAPSAADLGWWITSRPLAEAHQASTVSLPGGTWTAVALQAADVDRAAGFDLTTGAYTTTIPGWYTVSAAVAFSAPASVTSADVRWAKLTANGIDVPGSLVKLPSVPASVQVTVGIDSVPVEATRTTGTIQLWAYVVASSSVSTYSSGGLRSWMRIEYDALPAA